MGQRLNKPKKTPPGCPTGSNRRPGGNGLIKLVALGDGGVGKSCILRRFKDDHHFDQKYTPTVGVEFYEVSGEYDQRAYRLHLWDSGGQPRFRVISQAYLRGASAFFVVYDVGERSTFDGNQKDRLGVRQWVENARRANELAPILLVANKCDISHSKEAVTKALDRDTGPLHMLRRAIMCALGTGRVVTRSEGEAVVDELGLNGAAEVSAANLSEPMRPIFDGFLKPMVMDQHHRIELAPPSHAPEPM
mmetsp:Transcript_9989/g.19718  ORF Transcript_9989/g.19718 Transcript_9989/m.19718 type:complete len:248 (+) Transcript_9989:128-871(+)|eukprot:CAMPEP_0167786662 /NCGR_PEP_ID=MMETSP0111_2-20121227/8942_1 /TAXON_ID=91324 /ORGANISM="Lotharella globosa, Strain CCCM811" /LENGTH=247 /DNA_ID=CAMNT_0007678119 /DNA_START=82 /DNA_END=825 /DNA_ORIENTATION=+